MEPIVELIKPDIGLHIKIYPNGKVEGFDGVIINRIPATIDGIFDVISKGVIVLGEDIRSMKDLIK